MKKLSLIVSLFILPLIFVSCKDITGSKNEKVNNIELLNENGKTITEIRMTYVPPVPDPETGELVPQPQETYTVNAVVFPEEAGNKTLEYESSTDYIFTVEMVNGKAVITPRNFGKAQLIVSSTDKSHVARRYDVYVVKFITAFTMNNITDGEKMFMEDSLQLTATFAPTDATIKLLEYKVYKPGTTTEYTKYEQSPLTVDILGMLRVKAPGLVDVVIRTTDGSNLEQKFSITAENKVPIDVISPINENVSIKEFNTYDMAANVAVVPTDASYAGRYSYSSGNTIIATVDPQTGIVTGETAGATYIRVTTLDGTNISMDCPITVTANATDISRSGWRAYEKSYIETARRADKVIDDNLTSKWTSNETNRGAGDETPPQWLLFDMGSTISFERAVSRRFSITDANVDLKDVEYYITTATPQMENGATMTDAEAKVFAENKENWTLIGKSDFGAANSGVWDRACRFSPAVTSRYVMIIATSTRTKGFPVQMADFKLQNRTN